MQFFVFTTVHWNLMVFYYLYCVICSILPLCVNIHMNIRYQFIWIISLVHYCQFFIHSIHRLILSKFINVLCNKYQIIAITFFKTFIGNNQYELSTSFSNPNTIMIDWTNLDGSDVLNQSHVTCIVSPANY